jgi:Zn-dependent protease with chaperone function
VSPWPSLALGEPWSEALWRIALHSAVAATAFLVWSRRLSLPSGWARRWMLVVVLLVPMVTAVIGTAASRFAPRLDPWFDSARLLALPSGSPWNAWHLLLLAALATVLATIVQEVLPSAVAARRTLGAVDPGSERRARELPGWRHCQVRVLERPGELSVALHGTPWRPRLAISRELLEHLEPAELDAVLWHEHAHGRPRRWLATHLLFAVRALQCYNPVALWAFRELTVELELLCDREAAGQAGLCPLGRALLLLYEGTDPGDLAARAILRRRVDHLLGRQRLDDGAVPVTTLAAATLALLALLPGLA